MRLLVFFFACVSLAWTQAAGPLQLENKIQMSNVQGRIDHMSIDIKGRRLFVAALGNNTVEVIDLKSGKRVNGISGLSEPQGVLYLPDDDRLYVASGKDGTLRVFDGSSLKALKTIRYGDDADNVRYDVGHRHIYVGYGSGALGELDKEGRKIAEIKLDAHPESFQLEKNGPRIYANLPKARKIDVVRPRNAIDYRNVANRRTVGELSDGTR